MEKGTSWEDYHPGWKKIGEDVFNFLVVDFNCSISEKKYEGGLWLIFKNEKTRVTVLFDPHGPGVDVSIGVARGSRDFDLLKLVAAQGGKVRYPKTGFGAFLKKDDPREEYEVDFQKSLQCESIGHDEKRLRAVLTEYARLLLKYGTSILKGDHTLFGTIDKNN